MKLSGNTRPFAVLGHPIGHSLSPAMHNAAIAKLQMDAVYLALDVHPDRLMAVLPAMRDMGFGGVNLTVPLKEVAFGGLDNLDISAQRLGAVNTIEFLPDGGMKGHNTDGKGFVLAIEEAFHATATDKRVLIVGCGGAGRAVAIMCATEGSARLMLADIDETRIQKVSREVADLAPKSAIETLPAERKTWEEKCREADLVIQATPIGMKAGDDSVLSPSAFRKGQLAFDLIYMYPETSFMKAATEGGAKTANGLGMLLHQGAYAFKIWTGRQPPVDIMRKALEEEVYGT